MQVQCKGIFWTAFALRVIELHSRLLFEIHRYSSDKILPEFEVDQNQMGLGLDFQKYQ